MLNLQPARSAGSALIYWQEDSDRSANDPKPDLKIVLKIDFASVRDLFQSFPSQTWVDEEARLPRDRHFLLGCQQNVLLPCPTTKTYSIREPAHDADVRECVLPISQEHVLINSIKVSLVLWEV